jgi:hypothetical protein
VRRIAIVGAGQAGLQLALGLLQAGHRVSVVTDRTAAVIRDGRVMSTQCMFDSALQTERDLGINFWETETPEIPGVRYQVGSPDGQLQLQLQGELDGYAQSVDQRVKIPGWLDELERRGGDVLVRRADIAYLEQLARDHDLVLVATGKGEIGALFERDPARSPFASPQRSLAVAYVHGMEPLDPPNFSISIVPGVGEYFAGPSYTLSGSCNTMCFEALPGGEMDVWNEPELRDPDVYLQRCKDVLERFMPWEFERCRAIELTDPQAVLTGALTPVVREAVAHLPSGAAVLGVGDTVVLNDPLVGQGANNAAKSATIVLSAIAERGDAPFDAEWMQHVGEAYWDYVRWSTAFTNLMLAPPEHVGGLLAAGAENPAVANALANGTNEPSTLFPWIADPVEAERFVASMAGAAAS